MQGETYTDAQYEALVVLIEVLMEHYPEIVPEFPLGFGNAWADEAISDPVYHLGLLAEYHTDPSLMEPACLDMERIVEALP